MASNQSAFEQLLDRYGPELAAAFAEAIDAIKSNIIVARVVDRLERGDIDGAIRAMQIDPEAFAVFDLALAQAYNDGGMAAVSDLPRITGPDGNRVIFHFGVRNTEGERWLREHSAQLVTRIVADQREAIRTALEEGLAAGQNPRTTALNVVGRINPQTRRREGGIIGITAAQERYVSSARSELLSGDPALLRKYLSRERRDKRFDRTVMAALKAEKPLPDDVANKIAGRYSDRLLELRGEILARTETMMALSTARDDAIRQQVNAGKIAAADIEKVWQSAGDSRVRHTHRILDGKSVGLDEAFVSPSGARLRYPGDPRAPTSEIAGCRCWLEYRVDFFASVVRNNRRAN